MYDVHLDLCRNNEKNVAIFIAFKVLNIHKWEKNVELIILEIL